MSSNLNLNKAAAAILLAGLIGMVTGKVTEFLYDGGPDEPGQHKEEPRGYKVEVTDTDTSGSGDAAPATAAGDISGLYASADVKAGADFVNKKCTVCHDVSKGGGNKVGPHIWGVFNRPVASIGDFGYSSAMKAHAATAKTWNFDTLNQFLWAPGKTVPGTMMSFAGIPKDQERANVIAYLATQMTDSPVALPKGSPKAAATPAAKDSKPGVAAPAAGAKDAKPAANPAAVKANADKTTAAVKDTTNPAGAATATKPAAKTTASTKPAVSPGDAAPSETK